MAKNKAALKPKPGQTVTKEPVALKPNFIDNMGNKAIWLLTAILIVMVFIVYKDFLLLKKVFLFKDIGSDSINIYFPYWAHIADYLRTEGLPAWSHQVGMGQNIYLYDMGNPFTLLLYLGGKENIPYLIVYMEALKIILSGVFIYHYLQTLKISKFVSIAGALIYAFSGYMILGGTGWFNHSTEAFYASFFLFSLEKFISEKKWILLPLSTFFIGLWHAYFLFPYGIFFIMYFTVRFFHVNGFNLKEYLTKFIIAGSLLFLGILMSAPFVINFMLMVYNSPRVSGGASAFDTFFSKPVLGTGDKIEYLSFLMRLFSNDMIGNGNDYRGWQNYLEGPILYIGLSSLLLLPQFFLNLNKEHKKLYFTVAAFILVIIVFPWFRYMFWGFGLDYFRTFSFFISIFIFYIVVQILNKILSPGGKIHLLTLGITLLVLLYILYFGDNIKDQMVVKSIRKSATIFLLFQAVILSLLKFENLKNNLKTVFLITLCIELVFFSNITVSKRNVMRANELTQKTGYNDYTTDAVAHLNSTDKDFFRITKNYSSGVAMHGSMNDALVQNYKSTISYSSLNQKYYVQFLTGVGALNAVDQNSVKWVSGVSSRPILQSLVNCKYVLHKTKNGQLDSLGFEEPLPFGDVQLYKSKTYFPVAFPFDTYITHANYKKIKGPWKDIVLLNSFISDSNETAAYKDLKQFNFNDTLKPFTWDSYYALANKRRTEALLIRNYTNNKINGTIKVPTRQLLFLSIPFDEGWQAQVDGKVEKIHIVDYGLMGIMIPKGEHEFALQYTPPFKREGFYTSIGGVLIFGGLLYINKKKKIAPR